jgi:F-type H+-transporting ATPase subunit delta
MSINKIASRYAKSLIDLAKDQNKVEAVLEDVKMFKQATENRDLYLLLKSPIVNTQKKLSILKEIFDGKMDELTMSFVNIITKKGREAYLPEISESFINQYRLFNKISKIMVTTAQPLSAADFESIKSKLSASVDTLDNLEIETKVDPSLIGGFVIEIGDKLYDASVSHKLEQLKKQFSGNAYAAKI